MTYGLSTNNEKSSAMTTRHCLGGLNHEKERAIATATA